MVQGGQGRECGKGEGCAHVTVPPWQPSAPSAPIITHPHPLGALDGSSDNVLRSNPIYVEEDDQVVIIVDTSESPRRAPSTSSGYGSGVGSNGRGSPVKHYEPDLVKQALADSDGSSDCTLSGSLKDDIRACLGGYKWEKDVDDVVEAAVKGANDLPAARARLHAALLALQTDPPMIPNRGPSLPYYGPGVRPGDVTMMPKSSDMSLLATSALFTLDAAASEALARRLAKRERQRRRCRAVLSVTMLFLLIAAVGAAELFISRGRRLFGTVI